MAQPTDIDSLMEDLTGGTSSSDEVDTVVRRLESMLDVKWSDMFEGKKVKAPRSWPNGANDALVRLNFNEKTLSWSFGFVDKSKIIDLISRLKGLYKNEDVVDNPLEVALSRIPREDLKEIVRNIRRLGEIDEEIATEQATGPDRSAPAF